MNILSFKKIINSKIFLILLIPLMNIFIAVIFNFNYMYVINIIAFSVLSIIPLLVYLHTGFWPVCFIIWVMLRYIKSLFPEIGNNIIDGNKFLSAIIFNFIILYNVFRINIKRIRSLNLNTKIKIFDIKSSLKEGKGFLLTFTILCFGIEFLEPWNDIFYLSIFFIILGILMLSIYLKPHKNLFLKWLYEMISYDKKTIKILLSCSIILIVLGLLISIIKIWFI